MRMRAVAGGIELPAAASRSSSSRGGYHLMLTELKKPLVAGETVPLTLEFADRAGRTGCRAAGRAGARRRRGRGRRGPPRPIATEAPFGRSRGKAGTR